MILTTLQKLPNNVDNLVKTIDAAGFKCLPKKQKIAQSGHTGGSAEAWGSLVEGDEGSNQPKW